MTNSKSAAGAGSAAPVLEPTTQKFIDALAAAGGPPLYTLSPDAARDVLAGAQAQPVAKLPAAIEDTTFPVGPTGSVRSASSGPRARAARCRS
jgi:acetyl esterase